MCQNVMLWTRASFALICLTAGTAAAQIDPGSDGSDGDLVVITNTTIYMNSRPSGVYQYRSVYVASNVTVSFAPNANNTPVVWLVQSNAIIDGVVDLSGGSNGNAQAGGLAGPGGYRGGAGFVSPVGQGPGGACASAGGDSGYYNGGNASYGSLGSPADTIPPPGALYGNEYLIPLFGGSGGGSVTGAYGYAAGGGGGGGAILLAASGLIRLNGRVTAFGGYGGCFNNYGRFFSGGLGSGGAIRFVAPLIEGSGEVKVTQNPFVADGFGYGRVRFDSYVNNFNGSVAGVFSQGSQFVLFPSAGTDAPLLIESVGQTSVSATPGGVLLAPDVFVSALQTNPVPIVVRCKDIPLNCAITITVTPANGASVSAVGTNVSGTESSSTATVMLNMPRGGGVISAMLSAGN